MNENQESLFDIVDRLFNSDIEHLQSVRENWKEEALKIGMSINAMDIFANIIDSVIAIKEAEA